MTFCRAPPRRSTKLAFSDVRCGPPPRSPTDLADATNPTATILRKELGADSFDLVEFIVAIDERFQLDLIRRS
jgi:hypothetical protein